MVFKSLANLTMYSIVFICSVHFMALIVEAPLLPLNKMLEGRGGEQPTPLPSKLVAACNARERERSVLWVWPVHVPRPHNNYVEAKEMSEHHAKRLEGLVHRF